MRSKTKLKINKLQRHSLANLAPRLEDKKLKCDSGNKPCGKICIKETWKCHRDISGNFTAIPPKTVTEDKEKPTHPNENRPKKVISNTGIIFPAVACAALATVGIALVAGAPVGYPGNKSFKSKTLEQITNENRPGSRTATGENFDASANISPGAAYVRDQINAEILSRAGIDDENETRQKLRAISLDLPQDIQEVQVYTLVKTKANTLLNRLSKEQLSDRDQEEFQQIFGMKHTEYPEYYKKQRAELTQKQKEYREAKARGESPQFPKVKLLGTGELSERMATVGPVVLANLGPENIYLRRERERQLKREELQLITFCDARFNYNSPKYSSVNKTAEVITREKALHNQMLAEFDKAIAEGIQPPAIVTQERWRNLTSYVNSDKNIGSVLHSYEGGFNTANYEKLEASVSYDKHVLEFLEPTRAEMEKIWKNEYWNVVNAEGYNKSQEETTKLRDEVFAKVKAVPEHDHYQRLVNEYRAKTELMNACVKNMYDDLDLPQNNNIVDRIERFRESAMRDSAVSLVNFANDTEGLLENRDKLIFQFMMDRGGDDGAGVGFLLFNDEPFQDYNDDRRIDKKKLYNRLAGEIEKVEVPEVSREEIAQQRRIWAGMVADADASDAGREKMRGFLLRDFRDRTGIDLGDPKYSVAQNQPETVENPDYTSSVLYDKSTWDMGRLWVENNLAGLKEDGKNQAILDYLKENGYDRFTVMDPNPTARMNDSKWRFALGGSLREQMGIEPETLSKLSGTELISTLLNSYQTVVHNRAIKGEPIFYQNAHKFYVDGLSERSLNITGDKEPKDNSYDGINYKPGKSSFTKNEREQLNSRENRKATRALVASLPTTEKAQLSSLLDKVRGEKSEIVPKARKIVEAYNRLSPNGPKLNEIMAAWLIKNTTGSINFAESQILEMNISYPNYEGYPVSRSVEEFMEDSKLAIIYLSGTEVRSFTMVNGNSKDIEVFTPN